MADLALSHAKQTASITSNLVVHQAATRRYKARVDQAFSEIGLSIKVGRIGEFFPHWRFLITMSFLFPHASKARLGQVMDLALSHAKSHQECIQALEGQLAAALSRGHELRQHVQELQV